MSLPAFQAALGGHTPTAAFRRDPRFYVRYDGAWALGCATALLTLQVVAPPPLLTTWTWVPLLLPVACYLQILASTFVHVATHRSLPARVNRLVGEACAAVALTRFASWEIIHLRHHRYADDPIRDPHPLRPGYWAFLVHTVVNVERQLQAMYLERWGDTPANRRYERARAWVSYGTNLLLIAVWYRLLGPIAFFGLFAPAAVVGFLHLVHFNWATHDAGSATGTFRPVNLDRGWFWLGNRLWFGIYMHANHHRHPSTLNPLTRKG
jgi:fatty acid desaturase